MSKTEQTKILEDKIKANTLNFNLNRQSAIVSAFADGNFDKYDYLTRIGLALKPNSLQRARFQYSPLGNLLNKKLKVDDDDGDDKKDNESDIQDLLDRIERGRMSDRAPIIEESRSPTPIIEKSRSPAPIIEKSRCPTPVLEESRSSTPVLEELSKLDKLLKGLRDNELFLKGFKTNIDDIDNEEANKDKQQKLEAIKIIENLRDDLEEEMKTSELLKKGGKEAIDLINQLKNDRDELKNYQNENLEMLKRLKENLNNLPKPTPAPRPIQQSDLATQTIIPPRPATRPKTNKNRAVPIFKPKWITIK